jgi:hypothetical protein
MVTQTEDQKLKGIRKMRSTASDLDDPIELEYEISEHVPRQHKPILATWKPHRNSGRIAARRKKSRPRGRNR